MTANIVEAASTQHRGRKHVPLNVIESENRPCND